MKLSIIRTAFLNSIRRVEDILPLFRSGMLSKEEAVSTLKRLFSLERCYSQLRGLLGHEIIDAKDEWTREVALEWLKSDYKAVQYTVKWGIFTAEEIKPLIFMHLTRMFNDERPKNNQYEVSGRELDLLERMNYLNSQDVDTFLHSVFLMKSDVRAYLPSHLAMS